LRSQTGKTSKTSKTMFNLKSPLEQACHRVAEGETRLVARAREDPRFLAVDLRQRHAQIVAEKYVRSCPSCAGAHGGLV
jgi:hypothetical protein